MPGPLRMSSETSLMNMQHGVPFARPLGFESWVHVTASKRSLLSVRQSRYRGSGHWSVRMPLAVQRLTAPVALLGTLISLLVAHLHRQPHCSGPQHRLRLHRLRLHQHLPPPSSPSPPLPPLITPPPPHLVRWHFFCTLFFLVRNSFPGSLNLGGTKYLWGMNFPSSVFKTRFCETSLEVQLVTLCTSAVGDSSSMPGLGTKMPHSCKAWPKDFLKIRFCKGAVLTAH